MTFSRLENSILFLVNEWTLKNMLSIEAQVLHAQDGVAVLDGSRITKLDTAGCWILLKLSKQYGLPISKLKPEYLTILDSVAAYNPTSTTSTTEPTLVKFTQGVGANTIKIYQQFLAMVYFIGQTGEHIFYAGFNPKKMRLGQVCKYIYETGISAIPIIALMAFLISVVLAYQGATQLAKFGAEIFTVDLVALSILREMAVLLTAIMVAGRSGSAFTAEIGVMKVNEEVDALHTMGVSPFEILIMPRLVALLVSLPLLTFIADITGLFGAFLISSTMLDIPAGQFILRLEETITLTHFWAGMIKAPVFAFLIAGISCLRGMQIESSAEQVGRYTTISVVESIFTVILADAIFSIIYSELDI